jgi:hypothetical protein
VPIHVPGYRWRGGNTTRHQREGKVSGLEVFAQSGCRAPIAMNTSVHWSNDRVLRLIEFFQDNQCLWNCQHVDYKNHICKANSIENEMGIPLASVEAKIHNIRSQFMRERKKVRRSKTPGTGADDVYVPLTDERQRGRMCPGHMSQRLVPRDTWIQIAQHVSRHVP